MHGSRHRSSLVERLVSSRSDLLERVSIPHVREVLAAAFASTAGALVGASPSYLGQGNRSATYDRVASATCVLSSRRRQDLSAKGNVGHESPNSAALGSLHELAGSGHGDSKPPAPPQGDAHMDFLRVALEQLDELDEHAAELGYEIPDASVKG